MADLQKTIEIIFGGTDNLSGVIGGVESSVNSFSDNVTKPLSDVGDKALLAEAAILGMGVAFLGVAVNEAAEFETALNEIGTLFDATPEQVKALGDEIKYFGSDSVFSLSDIESSMYDMISATGDVDGAIGGLTTAQDLATVAGTKLSTSVNSLTTVLNSYGEGMENAGDVSDALFVTVQNGKTTLDELDSNLGKVTTTAAAAGVPFDQLGAAVAALTGAGNGTAESMTQLQNLIRELADPTDELKTAMGGLSLETDGMKPVMDALAEATGGNFTEMNALFGSVEATKAALVLANDSSGTFTDTLQAMADKTGVVTENMGLMEENLNLVTQNMTNNLNLAMIAIGDNLKGDWTEIVGGLSDLFQGTTVAIDDGAFDDVFTALNDFQIAVAEYLSGIAEVLPEALEWVDFSGLIESFGSLGESIGGIFGDLDLTDADDLKIAIQFVVDSFESLNNIVSGIIEAWTPAIKFIIGTVDTFNDTGSSAQELTGNILGASQVFEAFKDLLPAVSFSLGVVEGILSAIAEIKTAGAITTLGLAFTGLDLTAITTALKGFVSALTGPVGMVVAAGAAGAALGSLAADGIDAVIEKATGVEGASLGAWLYDVLHEDEGTTTANLQKVAEQIVKMDGFDYQFTDKILEILNAETTGETTADLLLDLEGALADLSDVDATKLSTDILSILESDLGADSTDQALQDLLNSVQSLSSNDGLPGAEESIRDFDGEVAKVADSSFDMQDAIDGAMDVIREMPGVMGGSTQAINDNNIAASELEKVWGELGKDGGTASEFRQATEGILEALSDPNGVYTDAEINTKNWIEATQGQKEAAENAKKPINDLSSILGDLTEAERLSAEQAHETELALLDIASNEQIAAGHAIVELEKKLLDLASNEKIAAMKFTAEIEVEKIKGQAAQITAAFQASADVIGSLSGDITELYSLFNDAGGPLTKAGKAIQEAAERQEARLDRELAIKEELTRGQLDLMYAQIDALSKETLVKIESSGLSQHIEAFMFEILQEIQLKISGDKNAFLLGSGG